MRRRSTTGGDVQKVGRDGNPLDLRVARGHEKSGTSQRVIRNLREHPIDTLLARRLIDATHHQAAQMLLGDWEAAQIGPVRASSLDVSVDNSRADPSSISEAQADAVAAVGNVLKQLGTVDRAVVMLVVVHRQTLDQLTGHMIGNGQTWNDRFAGPRVREALQALAEVYGLVTRHTISTLIE